MNGKTWDVSNLPAQAGKTLMIVGFAIMDVGVLNAFGTTLLEMIKI